MSPDVGQRLLGFALLLAQAGASEAPVFETRDVAGWTVWSRVEEEGRDEQVFAEALALLEDQLEGTARVLPTEALERLRAVPIWLAWETRTLCASYHPARAWLLARDYEPPPPESLIEVGNARNFLSWTREQPWMMLHELSHAYDHLILGEGRGYWTQTHSAAFEAAGDERYEDVLRASGKRDRHYSLSNPMEHFAETAEALLAVNDYFPFVRAQLLHVDPAGAAFVADALGVDIGVLNERARSGRSAQATTQPPASLYALTLRDLHADGAWAGHLRSVNLGEKLMLAQEQFLREQRQVARRLPGPAWTALADLPVIFAWRHSSFRGTAYIEAEEGLGGILLGAPERWVSWAPLQPTAVLRAYAEARHARLSDTQQAEFEAAYERVLEDPRWRDVLYSDGGRGPHAGLTSPRALFAELSEALFWANDQEPFVGAELEQWDPDIARLLWRLWG